MPERDEIAALEAVWGREASATAPPAPRPDLEAIFVVDDRERDEPRPGARRRRSGAPLAAGVAVVAVVMAAVAVARAGDDGGDTRRDGAASTSTVPAATSAVTVTEGWPQLGEPVWSGPISCRPAPDAGSFPICPVAVDDQQAYVLTGAGEASTVEARSLDDGAVAWSTDIAEGAASVHRLPSALLVLGVGSDWMTVSLDPATGAERWRAPGSFVGPVGPEHVVLDELVGAEIEERGAMSVVDTATGRAVLALEGTPAGLYIHPCDAAGLALVRRDGRLAAVDVSTGQERWAIPVDALLDAFRQVHCDDSIVAYVDTGTLHVRRGVDGAPVGAVPLPAEAVDQSTTVLAVTAGMVVVGSPDGARGFGADVGLEQAWHLSCRRCGSELEVGPAGDDVAVVIGDEIVVQPGDGSPGLRLELSGGVRVWDDGRLLAWGAGVLLLVDPASIGYAVYLERDDVRQAATGATHLVVTSADQVAAYLVTSEG